MRDDDDHDENARSGASDPGEANGRSKPVGYGNPPVEHRFKPGQSGNPNGRPKGRRNNKSILQEVAGKRLTVTENGRRRKKPLIEIGYARLGERVAKGDLKALAFMLKEMERLNIGGDAGDGDRDRLTPEEEALLRRILGRAGPEEEGE